MNRMSRGSGRVLVATLMLWALLPVARDARAMSPAQMQELAGAGLLGLPVDAVFRRCRLPAAIVDTAGHTDKKRTVRWQAASMRLSASDWELVYARRRPALPASAWTNPAPGGGACLTAKLSELVLHAKGNVGVLSVKKRADKQGYATTYRVPDDPRAAHRITQVTVRWKTARPLAGLQQRYGEPDDTVQDGGGARFRRYWVVEKNDKLMPVALHAVDLEIEAGGKTVAAYIVRGSDVEFVQQKLDALLRQWERDYLLD